MGQLGKEVADSLTKETATTGKDVFLPSSMASLKHKVRIDLNASWKSHWDLVVEGKILFLVCSNPTIGFYQWEPEFVQIMIVHGSIAHYLIGLTWQKLGQIFFVGSNQTMYCIDAWKREG